MVGSSNGCSMRHLNHHNFYKKHEEDLIRSIKVYEDIAPIALEIGRKPEAVKAKLKAMRLPVPRYAGQKNVKLWTPEEVQELKLCVTEEHINKFSQTHGCSINGIQMKWYDLKLGRFPCELERPARGEAASEGRLDPDRDAAYVRKLKEAIKAQGLDKPRFVFCKFRNAVRVVEPMWRHV